jgi:sulfur carrier protein
VLILTGVQMKVIVNGEETSIADMSVSEYLHMLEMDSRPLAIELNQEILAKKNYAATMLREGDQMEIVWFVGGG